MLAVVLLQCFYGARGIFLLFVVLFLVPGVLVSLQVHDAIWVHLWCLTGTSGSFLIACGPFFSVTSPLGKRVLR